MGRLKRDESEITEGAKHMRAWVETPKGKAYKERHAAYAREWRKKNRAKFKATQRRANFGARLEALQHYSGMEKPECRCCGETLLEFLHLDHVNGKGKEHRKEFMTAAARGHSGTGFFFQLRAAGYPSEPPLQVLCANCNLGKRGGRYCPHELQRGVALDGSRIDEELRGRFAALSSGSEN